MVTGGAAHRWRGGAGAGHDRPLAAMRRHLVRRGRCASVDAGRVDIRCAAGGPRSETDWPEVRSAPGAAVDHLSRLSAPTQGRERGCLSLPAEPRCGAYGRAVGRGYAETPVPARAA